MTIPIAIIQARIVFSVNSPKGAMLFEYIIPIMTGTIAILVNTYDFPDRDAGYINAYIATIAVYAVIHNNTIFCEHLPSTANPVEFGRSARVNATIFPINIYHTTINYN
jgi:hypothetical protein